jgi:hypothetical protein
MKYFVIFIVILTGFSVISFDNAFACSCQPPKPPPEEFARADAVFMGTVINLDSYQGHITGAEFEVQKIWKGILICTPLQLHNFNTISGYGLGGVMHAR